MAHSKSYAKLIQTDKGFYLGANKPSSSLLMSYDFHLDPDNNLKLIEVNTHSSGYLVSELVDQVQKINFKDYSASNSKKEAPPPKGSRSLDFFGQFGALSPLDSLKKSFEKEWKDFSGQTAPPKNILIVDHEIKNQKMYIEFLMYKDLLSSWGWTGQLHEIKSLSLNSQGILTDTQNQPVQMLYNRCTDFYFDNLPVLKKTFLEKNMLYLPSSFGIFIVGRQKKAL